MFEEWPVKIDKFEIDFCCMQSVWSFGRAKLYLRLIDRERGLVAYPAGLMVNENDFEEPGKHDTLIDDPFVNLSKESAQSLMDALWSVGIRPSNGASIPMEAAEIIGKMIVNSEMAARANRVQ